MAGGSNPSSQNDLNLRTVLFRDLRFNLFFDLAIPDVQNHRPSSRGDHDLWVSSQLFQELLEPLIQVRKPNHTRLSKTLLAAL